MKESIRVKKNIKYFLILFAVSNSLQILQKMSQGISRDIFNDDSYYYILPAINFIKHGFYSFDTINITNGFHPLFEWILTGLLFPLGEHQEPYAIYLTILIFICSLLLLFIIGLTSYAWFVLRNKSVHYVNYIYVVLALISFLFGWFLNLYINGMESVLVIVFVTLISLTLLNKKYFLTSILAMLLVASRLDTLVYFVIPLIFIFSFYHFKDGKSNLYTLQFFCKMLVPSMIFIILYMAFNYMTFGHIKPIHGALKSTFPNLNPQFFLINTKSLVIILSSVVLGIVFLIKKKYAIVNLRILGIAFGVITIVYILNFYLFQKWSKPIPSWYYSLIYFTGLSSLLIGIFNKINTKYIKIISFLFLLLATINSGINAINTYRSFKYQKPPSGNKTGIFDFLKTIPIQSTLAKTDTGALSFWSERNIINLDGLINNYEYQDYLYNKKFNQYISDKKVDFIIADIWENNLIEANQQEPMYRYRMDSKVYNNDYDFLSFYVYSYLYNDYSDIIKLYSCAEVFRTPIYNDGGVNAVTIIYDLKKNTECQNNN